MSIFNQLSLLRNPHWKIYKRQFLLPLKSAPKPKKPNTNLKLIEQNKAQKENLKNYKLMLRLDLKEQIKDFYKSKQNVKAFKQLDWLKPLLKQKLMLKEL